MSFFVGLVFGFLIGWLVFARPALMTEFINWLKRKLAGG